MTDTTTTRIVTAPESLGMYRAPFYREELRAAVNAGAGMVVADLTGVTFMDNSGAAVLVGALRYATAHGTRFGVVCAEGRVLRLFNMMKLTELLDIRDSAEAFTEGEGRDGA